MSQLGGFIWGIADQLRGVYKPAQYGTATLPFLILRRMECVLADHRAEINALAATTPNDDLLAAKLRRDFGVHFWNRTDYTLASLLGDPENLRENVLDYVAGFSANVADIFEKFGFDKTVGKLVENDRLYLVVEAFAGIDLHPDRVSNADMGEVFEHLIFKFSTASNETAGEHFTPRDAIRLIVDLVLAPDDDVLATPGTIRSIYDPTAGTGGMLSVAEEAIWEMNDQAVVTLAGQELNDESYAVCKSDMIAKGQRVDAIRLGDTLRNDLHAGTTFDYCLSNPPYGGDWKAAAAVVRKESEKGGGRFDAGLPRISDGQMLFLQHLVSKMRPAQAGVANSGGRAGIVLNGSPLFTGGAGSGESEIRRWLIESDLVDCIVALPTNMFYNTGIATYVWILDNAKPAQRRGKIQLIDATARWTKLRKNLGSKNREIGEQDRAAIVELYEAFTDTEESKILEPADFGFWEITVEQPLRLRFEVTPEALEAVLEAKPVAKLNPADQQALRAALDALAGQTWTNRDAFVKALRNALTAQRITLAAPVIKAVWQAVGERDETADICTGPKGSIEADTDLRDTELVPFRDTIEDYFAREVTPHVPQAWIDHSKTKVGYEIPFTRLFYKYVPPRPLAEIDADLDQLAAEIIAMLQAVEG
ncbi:SAM-dependent DNA methyltransferase [Propioniciclava coleopterorum]|uniref:site-specific DNA-methyltransferase (adenine-specific) n=1 Tax=Propioniciclava coleopterorum TaxID=2714937 RepID=A0A6G7Y7P8_9ACTN|nr:class I SAM-dependent DNA methyltransferase [Propioniciclava coleopterorum]QIK72739.1 SAM-dependent DNA methyltransferase [Propioniciclava coleopterorum]